MIFHVFSYDQTKVLWKEQTNWRWELATRLKNTVNTQIKKKTDIFFSPYFPACIIDLALITDLSQNELDQLPFKCFWAKQLPPPASFYHSAALYIISDDINIR